MGYNDDSIVKVDQEFFEPFNSMQIQVVGRLIQKQEYPDYRTVPVQEEL